MPTRRARPDSAAAVDLISHGPDAAVFTVTRIGETLALGDNERKELIEASRAGQHLELDVHAETYLQKDGEPNRNFVRFKASKLTKIARTGKNTPFLRNHMQRSQADRGGTVLASKAEKRDDGTVCFQQTLRVTTPWAVQGVLDGTIDRFSIGWHSVGPLFCAACKADWRECTHWPGDELEDGTVVEFEFQDAELVEVSAVNVPAVPGTGITEQIRAALSVARQPAAFAATPATEEKTTMDPKLLAKALGLPETATEEEILAAVGSVAKERSELALERASLAAERVGAAIDEALAAGRIPAEHREIYQAFGLAHGTDKLREKLTASPEGRFGPPRESTVLASKTDADPVKSAGETPSPTVAAYMRETGRTLEQIQRNDERNPALRQVLSNRARA